MAKHLGDMLLQQSLMGAQATRVIVTSTPRAFRGRWIQDMYQRDDTDPPSPLGFRSVEPWNLGDATAAGEYALLAFNEHLRAAIITGDDLSPTGTGDPLSPVYGLAQRTYEQTLADIDNALED